MSISNEKDFQLSHKKFEKFLIFFFKLMLESINHEGHLKYDETRPYTMEELAAVMDVTKAFCIKALDELEQAKLLENQGSEGIYIPWVKDMTGSETKWAKYKRNKDGHGVENGTNPPTPELENFQSMSNKVPIEIRDKRKEIRDKREKENIKEKVQGAFADFLED